MLLEYPLILLHQCRIRRQEFFIDTKVWQHEDDVQYSWVCWIFFIFFDTFVTLKMFLDACHFEIFF